MKKLKIRKIVKGSSSNTLLRQTKLDAELDGLVVKPEKYVSALIQSDVARRARRARKADSWKAIAWSLARIERIESAQNREDVLKAIAKEIGQKGRKLDTIGLVVSAVMGYRGRKDAQYLSRDRKVIELLQLKRIEPSKAAAFIKKHGGLSGCAAKARRLSSSSGTARKAKRPNQPLSRLYSDVLKEVNDRALIIVERTTEKPARSKVVTWMKIPRFADIETRNRIWNAITQALRDAVAKEQRGDYPAAIRMPNRTVR